MRFPSMRGAIRDPWMMSWVSPRMTAYQSTPVTAGMFLTRVSHVRGSAPGTSRARTDGTWRGQRGAAGSHPPRSSEQMR
jgi:hypothetical protein